MFDLMQKTIDPKTYKYFNNLKFFYVILLYDLNRMVSLKSMYF